MNTTETSAAVGCNKGPHLLHDAHVFAWVWHHPQDPDLSLFIAIDEGSYLARFELRDLFLAYSRQRVTIPPGVLNYAVRCLDEEVRRHRADFQFWQKSQRGRKSAAGRPSPKAEGEKKAQLLQALSWSLQSGPADPAQHPEALQILSDLNEALRLKISKAKKAKKALPRAFRGSHRNHAQASKNAIDVWKVLQFDPELTQVQAIRMVAECRLGIFTGADEPPQGQSALVWENQQKNVDGLVRTIERHFYRLKESLDKHGMPFLEQMLDD